MTTDYSPRPSHTPSSAEAPGPETNTRALADELVCHFLETMVSRHAAENETHDDVAAITQACLDMAIAVLNGGEFPAADKAQSVKSAAVRWARHGVPIETINHAVHESFQMGLELIASSASGTDADKLTVARRLATEVLDIVTPTMSIAYLEELRTMIAENRRTPPALIAALIAGHDTTRITRECGVKIAASYSVLAVQLPPQQGELAPETRIDARRTLRRVQLAIAARCPTSTLAHLTLHGGVILIPSPAHESLDELFRGLSAAAEIGLIGTCAEATPTEIPDTVDHLRELLRLAQQLHYLPGLYRFADLAVEYQLTRPSPARTHLGAMLDPLDPHPVLMETLRIHIGNKLNRRRSARQLNVHMNTVDYRLKKITELTGFDLSKPEGLWRLQSSLVVRTTDADSV